MFKAENRAALDELAGRRKPVAVVAAPMPEPKPDLASAAAVAGLVEAAGQMAAAAQQMAIAAQNQQQPQQPQQAQPTPARPQQMEAIMQRDHNGRLDTITIRADAGGPTLAATVQRDKAGKLEKLFINVSHEDA